MTAKIGAKSKIVGTVLVLLASTFLAFSLRGSTRSIFLPGPTTHGHYQIESECSACHTEAFADKDAIQAACVRCHGAELAAVNDSHPERKFTDPRNAERVAVLDARYCVTCHREHRPELVSSGMGLSLPRDYCYRCHESIADERPTHRGLGFETCANVGCHHFHDNQALYSDFLLRHEGEPNVLPAGLSPARTPAKRDRPLLESDADAPGLALESAELLAWESSAHAGAGVNCSRCHTAAEASGAPSRAVPDSVCAGCHADEKKGFERGRHGMRLAVGLAPLRVGDARQPMKTGASERTLGCTSCHGSHAFDTRRAAVSACIGCHDDEHSQSFEGSPHAVRWSEDPTGRSGASCATCHLPRTTHGGVVTVAHGQNDNLRPRDKMVREVCLSCHGLGFTLDALSDGALVARNFRGTPSTHNKSIEMARAHAARH